VHARPTILEYRNFYVGCVTGRLQKREILMNLGQLREFFDQVQVMRCGAIPISSQHLRQAYQIDSE
jgi:hypothetical protein